MPSAGPSSARRHPRFRAECQGYRALQPAEASRVNLVAATPRRRFLCWPVRGEYRHQPYMAEVPRQASGECGARSAIAQARAKTKSNPRGDATGRRRFEPHLIDGVCSHQMAPFAARVDRLAMPIRAAPSKRLPEMRECLSEDRRAHELGTWRVRGQPHGLTEGLPAAR